MIQRLQKLTNGLNEVNESVEFAENSPYPEAKELYEDVYTQKDYPYIKEN